MRHANVMYIIKYLTLEVLFMKRLKRFAALTAVILWGIMIIATLILAFIDNEACHKVFTGLLFTDIVFPVVIYAMTLVYKILSGRNKQ